MVLIGNKELIYFQSLLIPENDVATIPVDIQGWRFNLEIAFDNSVGQQEVSFSELDGGVRLTFCKWNNSIGTSLTEPAQLATLSTGKRLLFLATNYFIGGINKFSIELLLEGEENNG